MTQSHADFSTLLVALEHKQVVSYFDIASAALLIYDYLLTFGEEYALVWPARWRLGKFLFLLTRYLPFIDTSIVLYHNFYPRIGLRACALAYKFTGWTFVIGIGVAEVILIVRTCALWTNDRKLAIGLITLFISIWTPICILIAFFLRSLTFAPLPFHEIPGCFLSGGSSIMYVAFILLMIFETSILLLTLFKGLYLSRHGDNKSRLISTLYKDGVLCYIYLFVLSVINVVVLSVGPHDFATVLIATQRVMHSVLTARILLHLRGANIVRSSQTMSLETIDPPTLDSENIDYFRHNVHLIEWEGKFSGNGSESWFGSSNITQDSQMIEQGLSRSSYGGRIVTNTVSVV